MMKNREDLLDCNKGHLAKRGILYQVLPSSFHFETMKFTEAICSSNLTWKIYFTYKFKILESLFTHVRRTSFPRVLDSHQKRTARSLVNREHRGIFGPRPNSSHLYTYVRIPVQNRTVWMRSRDISMT